MRKTKIVATIGPASSDPAVFAAMCKAGVNVARLNFSHGTHEEQLAKIHMIKKVREELDLPIAIMLDTKGPEYRTGTFKNGKVHINDGDLFTFTTRDVEGSSTIVSVSYKNLAKELRAGDTILVNNGLVSFRVLSVEGTEIRCQAIIGGDLSDHKSMSFPNKVLKQPYLSEQDKKDLLLGIENGVDFLPRRLSPASRIFWTSRRFSAPMAAAPSTSSQKSKIVRVWITRVDSATSARASGRARRPRRRGSVHGAARHPEAADHYLPPARHARSSLRRDA